MKLFLVNGFEVGTQRKKSWVMVAQNPTNLNDMLPEDFDTEEIVKVVDGLTGKDRVVTSAPQWLSPDEAEALLGAGNRPLKPVGGGAAANWPTTTI